MFSIHYPRVHECINGALDSIIENAETANKQLVYNGIVSNEEVCQKYDPYAPATAIAEYFADMADSSKNDANTIVRKKQENGSAVHINYIDKAIEKNKLLNIYAVVFAAYNTMGAVLLEASNEFVSLCDSDPRYIRRNFSSWLSKFSDKHVPKLKKDIERIIDTSSVNTDLNLKTILSSYIDKYFRMHLKVACNKTFTDTGSPYILKRIISEIYKNISKLPQL